MPLNSLGTWGLVLLSYLTLAIVLTYPLILRFTTHVAGDGSDDPALAWNLWWVRYSILDLGRSPIYTDYMFYPIGLNLAFYTLTYLNAFLSIPFQFAFGLIPAANLNLLLSFALSGFGAYLLLQHLLRRQFPDVAAPAAFAAGLLYAFSSNKFLYASLGQFNIASSHWIPFYLLFLLKLLPARPNSLSLGRSLRYGFLLGLFLLFQALSEFTFASFLFLLTIVYLIYWLIATRHSARGLLAAAVAGLATAAVTFLIPMSPILAAMIADLRTEGDFVQSGLGFANSYSADLLGFFIPSHLHPLLGGIEAQLNFAYINFVYLGYVALALAIIAILRVPRARIWGLGFAIVLLIALGPSLRFDGREFDLPFLPFNALLEIPLIKGNRYPSRWSVMLTLFLAVMVGYGIAWILGKTANPKTWAACLVVSALLLFEHLSLPLPTSDLRIPEPYSVIGQDAGQFSVMELPLAWRNGFRLTGSYRAGSQGQIDPVFMLAQWCQTAQRRPILNGNTSRNPEFKFQYFAETPVLDSLIAIQEGHTVDQSTRDRDRQLAPRLLQFFNIRYIIWHAPLIEANRDVANRTRAYVENTFPLTKISESYENGRGLVVYRVNDLHASPGLALKPDDPLARLYLGEGWGALGGRALWMTRETARLLLPAEAPRNLRMALTNLRGPQSLRVSVNGHEVFAFPAAPERTVSYTFTVPASVLQSGMNEVILQVSPAGPLLNTGDGVPSSNDYAIGETGTISPVSIVVRSAGEEQGDFGHIYVSGVDESPNGRGYNLVILSPATGKVEARANFDTFAAESASQRLAAFIDGLPEGRIVIASVKDEASSALTTEAVEALKRIGAKADLRGNFRWSHAIIGVKGARSGTALEADYETRVSQLILGVGATEPNLAATLDGISVEAEP